MRQLGKQFARDYASMIALTMLFIVAGVALLGPLWYPEGPFSLVARPFQPPFGNYLMGTDMLGRDVMAGIVYGARTSLLISLSSTVLAISFGASIGAVAGYYGGWIDEILMRLTEMFQTIPLFLFAILLVAILTPTIETVTAAIALVSWPAMARLVRGEFRALRNREFVQACIGLGMTDRRIIVVHILPNCLSSIVVMGSLLVGNAILMESGLSFLGLSDPNAMSWGYMVGAGRSYLQLAPWLCAIPGIAILITVLALNLVGEGLNDALNPRLRQWGRNV